MYYALYYIYRLIFHFSLGIPSLFTMASRSKCAKFFALLKIVLMPPFFVIFFLFSLFTFPIKETLQAIGMENEAAQWGKARLENAGSFDVILCDLLIIFSAVLTKVQFEEFKRKREKLGPFLLKILWVIQKLP